jgi:hypothetical protein
MAGNDFFHELVHTGISDTSILGHLVLDGCITTQIQSLDIRLAVDPYQQIRGQVRDAPEVVCSLPSGSLLSSDASFASIVDDMNQNTKKLST